MGAKKGTLAVTPVTMSLKASFDIWSFLYIDFSSALTIEANTRLQFIFFSGCSALGAWLSGRVLCSIVRGRWAAEVSACTLRGVSTLASAFRRLWGDRDGADDVDEHEDDRHDDDRDGRADEE